MNSSLEQIKKELELATQRYEKLSLEIEELNTLLVSKRTEQAKAILKEEDTTTIVQEILHLQTRYKGAQQAHNILTEELHKLQKNKAVQVRIANVEQAESTGEEAMNVAKETYIAFNALVEKVMELEAKTELYKSTLIPLRREIPNEWRTGMIAARIIQPEYLGTRLNRLIRLWENLETGLFSFLEFFPKEIFEDKSLPTIDQQTKKLRRKRHSQHR